MNPYIQSSNPYWQDEFDFLVEALKVEYRKENPGKPASMERVHFASWVAGKLYEVAYNMDDDEFSNWRYETITTASKALAKRYKKYWEE